MIGSDLSATSALCAVLAGTGSAVVQWTTARVPWREPQGDGIAAAGLGAAGKAVRDASDRGWERNAPARGAVGRVTNCFGQFVEEGRS
jgi:hypothetical protein